ncbi:class I SAM-dependent methyltransferase [Maribacter hydrothermalis]|uniref:Methyltransferase n=1 Tax=Maribacter hydrothermalis TaxID=1836467 RepID=A0A1B7YZ42_9FLAO|nr:class I SAM-dependent methyltransferase [Maribacter hydrothermalis]APQ16083.1 SAM-dependent methyltransferase [Maribacter hydrothermalis]OBR35739.1 methyltransferase [Maribacter hydrothermalis]
MKDFWNARYKEESYAYGNLPNEFFKQQLDKLKVGSILLPAEGEGRNAVYALSKGWEVMAFDFSKSAKDKAQNLAKKNGFHLEYQVIDVLDFETTKKFDVICFCYTHFPSSIRFKASQHLLKSLSTKGYVIFEGFSKKQLGKTSGGPKDISMLYSIAEIEKEFEGLHFEMLKEQEIELNEGPYHIGNASVIRFFGSK